MNEQSAADAEARLPQPERWHALVDLLYLNQVIFLYLFSAVYPFMGLFYGTVYLLGSVSPRARRIGRICLILGIINLAVVLVAVGVILALALTGALAGIIGRD